jgi:hypothetical protein
MPTRMGQLIGSGASVARMLDEWPPFQPRGMMLTFDNFLIRIERFGRPSSRCCSPAYGPRQAWVSQPQAFEPYLWTFAWGEWGCSCDRIVDIA